MPRTVSHQSPLRISGVSKRETRTQFAAICYRTAKSKSGGTEILLVTSRHTGRWIIPKGWPMDGMRPAAAAAQEAWEEAGVRGRAVDHCLGLYAYDKWIDSSLSLPCIVAVFPVEVRKLDKSFPEVGERKRKWFSPKKAASKVDEPELKTLLMHFDPVRFSN